MSEDEICGEDGPREEREERISRRRRDRDRVRTLTCGGFETDEGGSDELARALARTRRLDEALDLRAQAERRVKRSGRELQRKLWRELQAASLRLSPLCSEEIHNTQRFLSITPHTFLDCDEDSDPDPLSVFETEVNLDPREGEAEDDEVEAASQETVKHQGLWRHQHRLNFIRRNIELAGVSGDQITAQERERIEALLREQEDEQHEDSVEEKSGERVVEDERHRQEEEKRLREIECQLELLEQSEVCVLSGDQLRNLLQDCETDLTSLE